MCETSVFQQLNSDREMADSESNNLNDELDETILPADGSTGDSASNSRDWADESTAAAPLKFERVSRELPQKMPTAGSSKTIQIRLLMLVGMLAMVIYAMNEAGKPERWQWMGFEEATGSTPIGGAARESVANSTKPALPINGGAASKLASSDLAAENSATNNQLGGNRSPNDRSLWGDALANQSAPSLPASTMRFWRSAYRELSPAQQILLLNMLSMIRRSEALDETELVAAQALVARLESQQRRFQADLFDKLTLSSSGSENHQRLSEELNDSQTLWEEAVLPALSDTAARRDVTLSQQRIINAIQLVLDPVMFSEVKDRTSIGWKGDTQTWRRLWELELARAAATPTDGSNSAQPASVSRIELVSQPQVYRGRVVSIAGWVRSGKREELPVEHSLRRLGITHFFELWIRPSETKLGPICIYTPALPANFPELDTSYRELNARIEASGHFFKVRTFEAAGQAIEISPVLVAAEVGAVELAENFVTQKWEPSRATLIALLTIIPISAFMIAYSIFLASRRTRQPPAKPTQEKIARTLDQLADDPNVQTDLEKVLSLHEPRPASGDTTRFNDLTDNKS